MAKKKTSAKKKPAKKRTAGKRGAAAGKQPTCFVVTGFGEKPDPTTGRVLNLDKTYEQLIRPACDRVGVNCFRAIDANLTGSIDSIMYRWIYEADIVIADLSTLNANVFYELGVRHAQREFTTVIIAESVLMQRIPFDLSSFVIHQYVHGGSEIAEAEQTRFVDHLANLLTEIQAVEANRRAVAAKEKREPDSPIFTFLHGMAPPSYEATSFLAPPRYIPEEERAGAETGEGISLAATLEAAEAAKKATDFPQAIRLFSGAIEAIENEGKKPDPFLAQRLALVTYKSGEVKNDAGEIDTEVAIPALNAAEDILAKYCAPNISNDPETLGLSGAINKRLFDHTRTLGYLDKAIHFYERGFYVKHDYYNGINVAFMYTIRANLLDDPFEAIGSYVHANMIRRRVEGICLELMEDTEAFQNRGDRQWILMTLGEVYQGMSRDDDLEMLRPKIEDAATDFGMEAYLQQKEKLGQTIEEFNRRYPAGAAPTAEPSPEVAPPPQPASATTEKVVVAEAAAGAPPPSVTIRRGGATKPIVIDANPEGRPIRSIEVSCKIDYE